jgi:hypothetical protein
MRPLLALSLVVLATACGRPAAPEGSVIHVRILDDASRSAGPQALFVTLPSGEQLRTRTGMDGTAHIRVSERGEYIVKVIPSAGYLVPSVQSKGVLVGELAAASVNFVLYRHVGDGTPPTPLADQGRNGW